MLMSFFVPVGFCDLLDLPQCFSCDSSVLLSKGSLGLSRGGAPSIKMKMKFPQWHHGLTCTNTMSSRVLNFDCLNRMKVVLSCSRFFSSWILALRSTSFSLIHMSSSCCMCLMCSAASPLSSLSWRLLIARSFSASFSLIVATSKAKEDILRGIQPHLIFCSLDQADLVFSHILQTLHFPLCHIQQLLRSPELWIILFKPGRPT